MTDEKNYIHEIFSDGVKLLTSTNLRFPKELSLEERITLIQQMIKYFEEREDYMMCAQLEKPLYKLIIKQKKDSYVKRPSTIRLKNSVTGSQTA